MKKRMMVLLITAVLIVTLIPISAMAGSYGIETAPITQHTVVDKMTYNGVTVESCYVPFYSINEYDLNLTYNCAGLVKKFYSAVFGLSVSNLNPSNNHPKPSVDRGTFEPTDTPVVGDIAASAGHWAIVKSVTSANEVVLFEQNCWSLDKTRALYNCTLTKDSSGVWSQGSGNVYREYWFWHYVCDQHQFTTEYAAASAAADGYDKEYCTVCGYVNKNDILHNWDEGKVVKQADSKKISMAKLELVQYTCTCCGSKMTKEQIKVYTPAGEATVTEEKEWSITIGGDCVILSGELEHDIDDLVELLDIEKGELWSAIGLDATDELIDLIVKKATWIPDSFFKGLRIKSVDLSGVTRIGSNAFEGCSITELLLPSTLQSLGEYAFKDCLNLRTVQSNVTNMVNFAVSAFSGCTNISTLHIPYGVTKINDSEYANKTNLTNVIIPSTVKSIGSSAFSGCTSLESVVIPDSVTSIGRSAFYNCTGLKKITMPISASVNSTYGGILNSCNNIEEVIFTAGSSGEPGNGAANGDYQYLFQSSRSTLKSIRFEEGVKAVPKYLCYECKALTSVYLPTTLETIGYGAFKGCAALKDISIPDSVTSIDSYAFLGCSGLGGEVVIPSGVTSIGTRAFLDCTSLESVVIPDSVTNIGTSAFYNCTGLKKITMPISANLNIVVFVLAGCNNIEEAVFTAGGSGEPWNGAANGDYQYLFQSSRSTLKSIRFEEGVKAIPQYLCYECKALASVYLPSTLETIGESAFYNCAALKDVSIPDSVTSIGNAAFSGCTGLKKITLPISAQVSLHADDSNICILYNCNNIEEVVFTAESSGEPGNGADNENYEYLFESSRSTLKSIRFEEGVKAIPQYLCYECKALTSVYLPSTLETIGESAFYNCAALKDISIPDSVTSISGKAFYGCKSIASITIPNSVTSIGDGAFIGCESITSITIPDSVTSVGKSLFTGCTNLTNINVAADNTAYCAADGVLFNKDKTELIQYPGGKCGSYTIPNSVTSIGDVAFGKCASLTSITIPDSVTSIGEGAFGLCESLTNITIPDSVTNIGGGAFLGCASFTSITIPDSVTNIGGATFFGCANLTSLMIPDSVTSIGEVAFTFCVSLTSIKIPDSVTSIGNMAFGFCDNLTNITIPDSVTSIGSGAFISCTSLASVTLPNSVTDIGESTFSGCTAITDVYFGGTEEQWKEMTIASGNDPLINANIHFTDTPTGDITGEGDVDITDLIRLKKFIADNTTEIAGSADLNGDGIVDILDLIRLKKIIAGETSFS